MSVEYLGKVSANLTSNQLGDLVGLSIATNVDITWLKFKVDGIELLVSDKHLGVNITWNSINDAGCVYGKEILIDGKRYKCRLLTGSNLNPASEDMSEWKTLMVDFHSQTNMIVNTVYTICQDDYYNSASNCVLRGGNSIESSSNIAKSTYSNNYGWRPVLERISSFTINGVSENIGEIATFNQFNYTVSSLDKSEFNLIEKVDGVVIRTLNNQLDGEFTFNVEGFNSLSYGNHSIEIIVHDISAGVSVSATSKFNKIKSPVQPIPTNSNLKQVMLHNKELEKEISYQNFRLGEKLKEKGANVSEGESLSALIDSVSDIGVEVSKQNGVASITNGVTNKINISSVDLSKSVCWCCLHTSNNSWSSTKHNMAVFESSSAINLVRKDYNSYETKCYWEVVEFKSGIRAVYNKQIEGTSLVERDSKEINHGFNIKNPNKCLIFYSFNSYNSATGTVYVNVNNVTSTTINITCYEKVPGIVNLYVVELL